MFLWLPLNGSDRFLILPQKLTNLGSGGDDWEYGGATLSAAGDTGDYYRPPSDGRDRIYHIVEEKLISHGVELNNSSTLLQACYALTRQRAPLAQSPRIQDRSKWACIDTFIGVRSAVMLPLFSKSRNQINPTVGEKYMY